MAFSQFDSNHHAELDQKVFSPDLFDDSESIDTSSVMDQPIMTPSTADRKGSLSTGSSAFFPSPSSANIWDEFPTSSSAAVQDRQHMAAHYGEQLMSNNPFHPQNHWIVYEHTPDSKTPVAPATYQPYIEPNQTQADHYTSNPFVSTPGPMMSDYDVSSGMSQAPATIMPSVSSAAPMALAEQDSQAQRANKRLRQQSPSRTMSPGGFLRRDGVRKKNHKMEIPLGRNLMNIDQLIQECTNDDDLKELKQQKRLLRNRQAA
jgi:hypothetical protein